MKLLISNQKPAKGYSGALLHDHSVVEKHTHFVVKEPLLLWSFLCPQVCKSRGPNTGIEKQMSVVARGLGLRQ